MIHGEMRSMKSIDTRIFADLKDRGLKKEGIFVAEGRFMVERLLASKLEPLAVLCAGRMAAEFTSRAEGRCPLIVLDDEEIARIAGFDFHRGVMAAGKRPEQADIGRFFSDHPTASRVVVCAGIGTDYNLGGIMRSAAAFGYDAVAVTDGGADPWSRRSLRASMGAPFFLPVPVIDDSDRDIALLKERGFTVCATVLSAGAKPLPGSRISGSHALVFGSEADGLDDAWKRRCDMELTIPVSIMDSLNVGVAAGIFMYHMTMIAGVGPARQDAPF